MCVKYREYVFLFIVCGRIQLTDHKKPSFQIRIGHGDLHLRNVLVYGLGNKHGRIYDQPLIDDPHSASTVKIESTTQEIIDPISFGAVFNLKKIVFRRIIILFPYAGISLRYDEQIRRSGDIASVLGFVGIRHHCRLTGPSAHQDIYLF